MTNLRNDPKAQSELGKNLPVRFHHMLETAGQLIALCEQKNKAYGNAWKKRGGVSAFFAFAAKLERLEQWAVNHDYNLFDVTEDYSPESIDETLKDLINYFFLVLDARAQLYTKVWDSESKTSDAEKLVGFKVVCDATTNPADLDLDVYVPVVKISLFAGGTIEEDQAPVAKDCAVVLNMPSDSEVRTVSTGIEPTLSHHTLNTEAPAVNRLVQKQTKHEETKKLLNTAVAVSKELKGQAEDLSEDLPKPKISMKSEQNLATKADLDLLHGKPIDLTVVNSIKNNSGALLVEATVDAAAKTADAAFKAAAVVVGQKEIRGRMVNGKFIAD